jgi:hypothetical protein
VEVLKISEADEWARHLRDLSKQARNFDITLSGRIKIETDEETIEIEL